WLGGRRGRAGGRRLLGRRARWRGGGRSRRQPRGGGGRRQEARRAGRRRSQDEGPEALRAADVREQGHSHGPRWGLRGRAGGAVSAGYLENTNLPIGPSSGPSSSGRHRIVSSILRASVKSLSVIPSAECVASFTQSLPQVTLRSV